MSLEDSIEPAFKGLMAKGISIDGHSFEVKPLEMEFIENGLKVESSFRHVIVGKDDRVHYILEAVTGQPYKATLVKIDFNGIAGFKVLKVGATFVGAGVGNLVGGGGGAAEGIAIVNGILNGLSKFQKLLIGKWEPSAVKLIDALGARLSKDVG